MREDRTLTLHFLPNQEDVEKIRNEIGGRAFSGKKIATSIDLPLSNESKRILAYAAEEAERLNHRHIGSEHLLLGILREENSMAAQRLMQRGISLDAARRTIKLNVGLSTIDQQPGIGTYAVVAPSGSDIGIASARVIIRRFIEFQSEADGTVLATTPAMDVPRVGEEIALIDGRARVTRVVHHYDIGDSQREVMPQKIVVHVQLLPK